MLYCNQVLSYSQRNHKTVLDLGLISIASLEPRASTKVESHLNLTESRIFLSLVSQPIFFFCSVNKTQRS